MSSFRKTPPLKASPISKVPGKKEEVQGTVRERTRELFSEESFFPLSEILPVLPPAIGQQGEEGQDG